VFRKPVGLWGICHGLTLASGKVRVLARKEKRLIAMPKLINPFIELGKLKGRQEGRAEGRHDGELMVISRLFERKFPGMAKKAAPLLRRLDEENLLAFGEALLFIETPAKCMAWLKERA
jgi:hypothetical protein